MDEPQQLPAQVEQAATALLGVASATLGQRADLFDEVHRLLQDALAEVEGT